VKQALVIVAHPDDEVVGIGGTILKLQKEYGYKVHVEFMTTAKHNTKWVDVQAVSKKLGTTWMCPHPTGDNNLFHPLTLDGEPISNLVDYIEPILKERKPEIVFTHHIGDLNQDHRAVAEAVLIATRPYPGQYVKKLYTFDTPCSTVWGFGEFKRFEPNVFMDIDAYSKIKIEALEIYKEEIKDLDYTHPRSLHSIQIKNFADGAKVGLKNVETFRLLRSIGSL